MTRYVRHGLKRAPLVTVKLQNVDEESSSVSGSVTKRSWPMCSTHFGTENELTWDFFLIFFIVIPCNRPGYINY